LCMGSCNLNICKCKRTAPTNKGMMIKMECL
jgi:hypothetical protein